MWRIILQLGHADSRWLHVPIQIPLLYRKHPKEDLAARWHRQVAAADIVGDVNACTTHGNDMGCSVSTHGNDMGCQPSSHTSVIIHVSRMQILICSSL